MSRVFARLGLWLGVLGAATSCSDSAGPSEIAPTAMQVDPLQLELAVGDTGQVHVVLLASGQVIAPDAQMNGSLHAQCSYGFPGPGALCEQYADSVAEVVGQTTTANATTFLIIGLRPGVTRVPIHYLAWHRCEDPPECWTAHEFDYLPSQSVTVTVH